MQLNLGLCLVWATSLLSSFVVAGPYSSYDISTLIPYEDQRDPSWSDLVHVRLWVGSTVGDGVKTFVDTGSTGIVLPAKDIPGFTKNHCTTRNSGFHYLTSSNILYKGCWLTQDIYFNVGRTLQPVVHARVPVLAVTQRIQCRSDTDDRTVISTGDCTNKDRTDEDPTCDPLATTRICFGILGIGWGRLDDGQPQGTSDKNPLINIVDMTIPTFDIRRLYKGFIVQKDGITVGLTDGNTLNLDFGDLTEHPNVTAPPPPPGTGGPTRNWNLLPACIWMDAEDPKTADCQPVSALLDTGIPQSYFRTPTTSGHLPPRDSMSLDVTAGTAITVSFMKSTPSTWRPVHPAESFRVKVFGSTAAERKHDVSPTYMRAYAKDGYVVGTFFNSGMRVFRRYEVCHDAQAGRVGFRLWS